MIEASFIVLEDATRDKLSGQNVYEGQPVALNAAGKLVAAASTSKVYGISKLDSNTYRDFAFGEFGAFGTGKLTVVSKGIVRVKASVYNKIEMDSSATVTSPVTVQVYDTSKTYVPGEALYVDAAGLITNAAVDKTSILGRVVAAPASAGDWLELEILPLAAASELAA
jgi:hypothetical protein